MAPSQDEEGQSVPFVQKLWEQYVVEKDEYLNELKQELGPAWGPSSQATGTGFWLSSYDTIN